MFEPATEAVSICYEASLVERIAELERGKSAAAAEQARPPPTSTRPAALGRRPKAYPPPNGAVVLPPR
jgi:hypothetical protein